MPDKSTSPQTQRSPSGFTDLLNLVTSPSRLSPAQVKRDTRLLSPSRPTRNVLTQPTCSNRGEGFSHQIDGVPYAQPSPLESDPKDDQARRRGMRDGGLQQGRARDQAGRVGVKVGQGELRKRKIDKRMIGHPTDFR